MPAKPHIVQIHHAGGLVVAHQFPDKKGAMAFGKQARAEGKNAFVFPHDSPFRHQVAGESTGPHGGVFHLSASGQKVYGGN